ncbi:hypothetical protein F511_40277 [Dorcoceras hygrometricum]|uniref:Uncharacterized protein n=1 Tax=Dorcoceras hygrometricum TaxID=472368 RepID=A0A2Z7CUA1_9LAMI|nr:hypothetical protein F511_40277 [Dorcoceras hygrometricum]
MTFRVVRTNQYNQDLGLIHSTNGNHLESPNEGSSMDHQVTIHLHAQNITMFPTNETWYFASQMLAAVDPPIRSTTGNDLPPISLHWKADGFCHGRNQPRKTDRNKSDCTTAGGGGRRPAACVRLWRGGGQDLGIQLVVGPQPLWLRNHNFGLAQWIMVKRLATSCHDPIGITDSSCKNQLVVVSVQYGPFNTYIPIRSTTIGKSRVAIDLIAMHTSWRSNSDITSVTSIGYPRMRASGESSTTKHRLLHASGPHPIQPSNDPNESYRASEADLSDAY